MSLAHLKPHLYLTHFHSRGTDNPENWKEKLIGFSKLPIGLLGLKMTQVFHCTWEGDAEAACKPASDETFQGANGVTINQDGSVVYVNDPGQKKITVMEREKKSGKLSKVSEIVMPLGADNIEYDDEADEIIIGSIPDFLACMKKMTGEDVPVPGGMAVARKSSDNAGSWVIDNVLNHDGKKLAQISAAARLGSKVVLGSPFSEGILVCKME
jgi:hypothetical protein